MVSQYPDTHAANPSGIFQLLASYHPHLGWDKFVKTIDFTGVTPRQIYQVVLAHPRNDRPGRRPTGLQPAAVAFSDALVSKEFRQSPHRRCCAPTRQSAAMSSSTSPNGPGADLILSLGARSVTLPKLLEVEGWTSDVSSWRSSPASARRGSDRAAVCRRSTWTSADTCARPRRCAAG